MATATRIIRAPRGTSLSCKGWPQEAALRMLMNNLDPDVAERPDDLIVYGGSGKAARNWPAFDAIVRSLTSLEHDETLLVQSGKPVGVFQTHPGAPRVLIVNALLVPAWATWENFRDLEDRGLTMYGQMTAGSWIYIGSQGIVQGTYETLAAVARRHFGGSLTNRLFLSAGMGGMGGAQPLAAVMNGAAALVIEVDPQRIARRLATKYLDEATDSLDEALDTVMRWTHAGTARSIGLRGNAADVLPALVARGITPDVLTDQTSAHDALEGYVPNGMSLDEAVRLRERNPDDYIARSMAAMAEQVRAMLAPPSRSTTATTSARRRSRLASPMHSTSPASCPSTSARSSVRAKAPSAGRHSRATPPTSASRMRQRSRCSDTIPRSSAGSSWRRNAWRSRVCRHASCGSATASARASGCASTSWRATARARRRSSSAAIISIRDRWRRPTGRPKGCATAAMRLRTGRF